jgi:hypothetical protein
MLDLSPENLLHSIFHTLAYADVFDYPLSAGEVNRYLINYRSSIEPITHALHELVDSGSIVHVDGYFALQNREAIIEIRKHRAKVAVVLWPKAARYGRMIASLPFVRMVAVTGSLAMNNTNEGNDVDYMIVTAPNHLWTCRALTLLVARLAKLEGLNLCPNYLITTDALELQKHSLYVAHELAQMVPLSGIDIYRKMRHLNDWMNDYLPNAFVAPELPAGEKQMEKPALIQRILEVFLCLPFADWFEKWEMNRKIAKLTEDQSSSSEAYFSADVCKGHVDKHGQSTEIALYERMKRFDNIVPSSIALYLDD